MRIVGEHIHETVEIQGHAGDFRADCIAQAVRCQGSDAWIGLETKNALLDRWVRDIGFPDPEGVIAKSLLHGRISYRWGHALEGLGDGDFDTVMRVSGREHIEAAKQANRGVLFVTMAGLFIEALVRWTERNFEVPQLIIGLRQGQQKLWRTSGQAVSLAAELKHAQGMLRRGEHAHILIDGYHGSRGLVVEFYGRFRSFQPTFAELAERTGAVILPTLITLSPDGFLDVAIQPPMQVSLPARDADGGLSDAWREAMMLRAAKFIAYGWHTRPQTVKWGHIHHFYRLRPVPAETGGKAA